MDQQHELIARLSPKPIEVPPDVTADFLGICCAQFDAWVSRYLGKQYLGPPAFDEEYFEWIDVAEAAAAAQSQFVMLDLGAGYGRWLVRAAAILKQLNPLPYRLVAVEAEPTHFEWLGQHLRNNGIDPDEHELHQAAVNDWEGHVEFQAGDPLNWWGQSIIYETPRRPGSVLVRSITLAPILSRYERIDLIDLDIQGAELAVLSASIRELNSRVKRVHVGTHGKHLEEGLRRLFTGNGWTCIHDFPSGQPAETRYGTITFVDGVQSWINLRF